MIRPVSGNFSVYMTDLNHSKRSFEIFLDVYFCSFIHQSIEYIFGLSIQLGLDDKQTFSTGSFVIKKFC